MRLRTKFMIPGSVAAAAVPGTPGAGAAQALSRPDGWHLTTLDLTTDAGITHRAPQKRADGDRGADS